MTDTSRKTSTGRPSLNTASITVAAIGLLALVVVLNGCNSDTEVGHIDATTLVADTTMHSDTFGGGLPDVISVAPRGFEETPLLPVIPPTGTVDFTWQEALMPVPVDSEAFVELIAPTADGYLALGHAYGGERGSLGLLAWQSNDGLEWVVSTDIGGVPLGFEVHDIVSSKGSFVAVGGVRQDAQPWEWRPIIIRSPDGLAWSDITPEIPLLQGEQLSFHSVAVGTPGVVVAGSIDFDPGEPPLEIHKDGLTLHIDYRAGKLEITDLAGDVRYAGSIDELYNDVYSDEGVAVFHPDSRELLFVIPWEQVDEIDLRLPGDDEDEHPTEAAPPGAVRDQGQIYGTVGLVDLDTGTWSQSITAGIDGQLAAIQIFIETSLPVVLDLTIFEGGNPPTGAMLFSEQVIAADDLYTWDVSSAELSFEAGDVFTFTVNAQTPGVVISANDDPGYRGGEAFRNGAPLPSAEASDLGFITYVGSSPADPGGVPPIALEIDGHSMVLSGYEPGDPESASFEIRELATGSLIATGDFAELSEGPPPRFVADDGSVVLAFGTWDEYWEAEQAAYEKVGAGFEEQHYSKPLAMTFTDAQTWFDIDLNRGIAANQVAYVYDAVSGADGFVLRGSVENRDTSQSVDVSWSSPNGTEWELSLGSGSSMSVWDVAATPIGFLGFGGGDEGTAGVLYSSDGMAWEPVLVLRDQPGAFGWFDSLATGALGTFVTRLTELDQNVEAVDDFDHGHGEVVDEEGDHEATTTSAAQVPPTTQSPAHLGSEGAGGEFTAPETSLFFSRDGRTFYEVTGAALEGRLISRLLVAGDRVFAFTERFAENFESDHDGQFEQLVILVGHPTG